MDVRQLIRSGITASAAVHFSALALILLFSDVHPFGAVTAEPITVDLVTPEEFAKKQEPDEKEQEPEEKPQVQLPQPESPQPDQAASTQPAKPPSPAPQAEPQQHEAPPERNEAAAQPQSPPPPPAAPPAPPPSPQPAYAPPEPDLTVKYHVALGLPDTLPPVSSSGDKPGDGIDATASSTANVGSSVVVAFRKHLKSCSKLPASVSPSDNVMIKLRVLMTPQARLAAEPILIEGTASMKGVGLKKSAVEALMACQPYDMLPPDRYGEWKVLDLSFTPQDFV